MPCYDCQVENANTSKFDHARGSPVTTVALVGNPNVGKTSLFNAMTGLRARITNFPGTTVEHKSDRVHVGKNDVDVIDLPGVYSLTAATPEEQLTCDFLIGKESTGLSKPDCVIAIADATNVERSLFLVSQILDQGIPVIIALNMIDAAERNGIHVDVAKLGGRLGCPVVPTIARSGQGVDELKRQIDQFITGGYSTREDVALTQTTSCMACGSCPFQSRYTWSEQVASECVNALPIAWGRRTEQIDRYLTHPVLGLIAFLGVMLTVFYLIFSVANIPMDLIDALFAHAGAVVSKLVPHGKLQSLLVDGVIGGVGGMLVFLPQICILFFFLALLEDSGYLARAAFVMDRIMRRIGLPGTAFVPLLSAHACAIPAIMSTRVIRDTRDRLVTILVAPLMSCSARIPVYAMVTALLFPDHPGRAAIIFTGAYSLGIGAAVVMAYLFKKTILPGDSKPLVLELPEYRIPSLRSALIHMWDRGQVFVRQAGTIILVISIILWTLASFPTSPPPAESEMLMLEADRLAAAGEVEEAVQRRSEANRLASRSALANSLAGRLGKLIEPVVRPLGFDWQIGIGVITSFAAREVIVSTLAVVYGVGDETIEDQAAGLYATLRNARKSNGAPVFTTATSMSLLVFYVLAMQCLPTQAVTRRETGGWKWPIFQIGYMTALAYSASFITYQILRYFNL